jgi:hypothetical protein
MKWTQVLCSKYFKRYVERELHKGRLRRQWHPLTGWKEMKKEKFHPNEHRPWSTEFMHDNPIHKRSLPVLSVEPIKEWNIFTGDRVSSLIHLIYHFYLPHKCTQ